jgi:hypothetical protein
MRLVIQLRTTLPCLGDFFRKQNAEGGNGFEACHSRDAESLSTAAERSKLKVNKLGRFNLDVPKKTKKEKMKC